MARGPAVGTGSSAPIGLRLNIRLFPDLEPSERPNRLQVRPPKPEPSTAVHRQAE